MLPGGNPLYHAQQQAFNDAQIQYAAVAQAFNTDPSSLASNMAIPLQMGRGPGADTFTGSGFTYMTPGPVSNFMASLDQLMTQELPQVDTLAMNALDGITRAYDSRADPAQVSANLTALRAALQNLYTILKDSGLGALPLSPSESTELLNPVGGRGDPRVELLTEQVNAIFKEGKNSRERATAAVDVLKA